MKWWKALFKEKRPPAFEPAGEEPDKEELDGPMIIPVEDWIDLHTFRPAEVGDLLEDYLREAHARGFTQVRIIHGKGAGIMKKRVEALLSRHPLVYSFRQADETRGGWGATVAELRSDPEMEDPTASPP